MSYMHIDNLYRDQTILLFKECYAMEKIHGTSAHVSAKAGVVGYFAGGCSHDNFARIFNTQDLSERFAVMGHASIVVFGEAYGGKVQRMKETYGEQLRFVAFEVRIGDTWLDVKAASDVVARLGLDFVPFVRLPTTIEALNAERDRPSRQAVKLGCGADKVAEGLVLRPLQEFTRNDGKRVIAKYKHPQFAERASCKDTQADTQDSEAQGSIHDTAIEWVTDMRLAHVLDALEASTGRRPEICDTKAVINAMADDIIREGAGCVDVTRQLRCAIGKETAKLFHKKLTTLTVNE